MEENLGGHVPLELSFSDETGKRVQLSQLITQPTLLTLNYYHCGGVCDTLLEGVADMLNRSDIEPGKDFSVITVSFDPKDTPADALKKKKEFYAMLKRPLPGGTWRFLTGDQSNIDRITQAVGFRYKKQKNEFLHPVTIIVLSPSGKVIRYMPGVTFLPADIRMAVREASEGRIGPTIRKVFSFCYTYEPKGRRYVLNVMRLFGALMVLGIATFLIFLAVRKGSPRARTGGVIDGDRRISCQLS